MPSVSIWAISRRRPAPSAVRIAISFCRAAVRASSRFDRLAQTISMTTATAPASTQSAEAHPAVHLVRQRLHVALEGVAFGMLRRDLRGDGPDFRLRAAPPWRRA